MSTIKIRRIKKMDLDVLAEIYNETYSVFDVGEKWTKDSASKMLEYWLHRKPDLAFLAEYDGKIVGAFVVGVKPWWDGNHLVDGEMFVHPNYQKRGIGTELLRFVLDYALKKYKITRFDSYTFKGRYPARWYKSVGFEEIKEWIMISADPRECLKKLKRK